MDLLVSVRDVEEATAAVAGGADIVDAKEPSAGALGAVSLDTLTAIVAAVRRMRPVTAALGDATDEETVERAARAFVAAGAALVKVGFAGTTERGRLERLCAAAVRGAGGRRLIAVAYADHRQAATVAPAVMLDVAVRAGAGGLLIDTAAKQGGGLLALIPARELTRLVGSVKEAGLLAALAGQLTLDDFACIQDTGADVAGVRGSACDGGRTGRISAARVALLARHRNGRGDTMEACQSIAFS